MGKGQRTKGNTKPSSSRRTAELLGTEAVNSFIGFSSLSSNTTEDEDIDSDFKVVFKKMSKKDCITKVKALQEFQRLINDKTETSVKKMLVQWPRLYNKLAIDIDWRVREATHKSQEQLVIKIGRNIAPHLKQMMPIWLTSQYDPYTPAATAATASFDTAFPATRKLDVLVFTKSPVLNYIKDMLLNQTIESVSEESATPEENSSKYNRLVSNSLQGLSALISSLPSDTLDECQNCVQELVNSNKFWKLAKFPNSSIRSSWFRVVSTLAQHIPQLFISNASKICGLTLGGLDEKDFLVVASVWECALLCVITIDDCWKFVNFRKAFYPQLRIILREGGRGNAATIFPNLLPLLSRVPHESTDNFIEFHKEFYTFLREGLGKTLSRSQSESNAIIKAYMECLRFSISSNFIDEIENRKQFESHLIQNELLSLVNESISTNDCLSKSSLFNDLAILWLYLSREDKYQELIRLIRHKLADICLKKIEENDFNSFPRISRLFLHLFSDTMAQKKDKKIRFRRESDDDDYKSKQNLKLNELITDGMAVSALNQITEALIEDYHSDDSKYQYLELLIDLFRVHTKDSFNRLLKVLIIGPDTFWTAFIKEWFRKCVHIQSFDEKCKRIKTLVDLTIILLTFIEEKHKKYVFLDEIVSLNDPFIIEGLISEVITSNDSYLLGWLKSESTGNSIVKLTSKLINHLIDSSRDSSQQESDVLWKLISHCFTDNSINKLCIEIIIDKFRQCLQNISRSSSKREFLVEFTCRLASQLFSSYELCTSLTSARDLLFTILSINCRFDDPNKQLSNAWKTGLTNIVKSNGCYLNEDGIVSKLVLTVKSRLNSNITSIENAELVFRCGFELIDTIYNAINSFETEDEQKKPLLSDPNIELIFNYMLLSNNEWNELVIKCDNSILHYDWLNRDILFDSNNCQMVDSKTFNLNGVPFVFSAVCTALLLEKLIESNSTNELSPYFFQILTNQLKYILTASAYLSVKSKSEQSKKLASTLSLLKKSLSNILNMVKNQLSATKITELLFELSMTTNRYSTQALSYFVNNFVDNFDETQYLLSFDNLNYNQIITFQELSSHLPQALLKKYLVQSLNAFVCCESFVQLEDGIAKLALLHSCLKNIKLEESEDISEIVTSIMETLCGLKSSNSDMFYHNNDIESNSDLQFYCLICQVFDVMVDKYSVKLSQTHWDLIFISTTLWIQNIIRQKDKLETDLSINIFMTKVFKLVQTLAQKFDDLALNTNRDEYWERLFIEWQEFHSKHFFDYLVTFYFHFSDIEMNFYEEILFKFVSKVVVLVPYPLITQLLSNQNKESLPIQAIDKKYNVLYLPEDRENVLNIVSPLLLKSHLPIALSAHQLILRIIPFLLKDVNQPKIESNSEDEEEDDIYLTPPKTLLSLLQQTDSIVEIMLSEYSIECCCDVEPQTDSFTYTFAYLLLWVEILELFANIREENPILRSQMISFLKVNSLLSHLLKNLFRLMPLFTTDSKLLSEELFDKQFTRHSLFACEETVNSSHIQRLAFHLYYLCLRQLPAAVREWFKSCDRKTSEIVNEITINHFSGIVCSQELEAVQKYDSSKFNNMTVKARLSAREVAVKYTFEEMSFELSILFPNNYPLDVIKHECIRRFGVKEKDWQKWMLQLMRFLNYLDGSVLDALTIFKKNIDKQFEGFDECMICFYVLHGNNYSVPDKFCTNCKKAYHSACLHKWFRTSNNTLCPMCRQLWIFYGSRKS